MSVSGVEAAPPRFRALARSYAPAVVVLNAACLQIRAQQHPANIIFGVIQPASFLGIAALASRGTGRVELGHAALGAGLVALWGATVWASGSILRAEQWQGTLPQILSRRTGLGIVLFGKTLGATARSAVLIGATVAVATAVFGEPLAIERPLLFAAALFAVLGSALSLGMLLSCLFMVTRAAGRISEALMYPVFILGGLLVPIELLPGWVAPLSTVVSLRWGSELLRAAAAGEPQSDRAWLLIAVTTTAYAVLARWAFERVLIRARRDGSIDLY